jgi:Flp pilus assembly protein TadD
MLKRDEARLLGKIAFLGMWQGRFVESEAIFNAIRMAEPERIGPLLGLGMLRIHQGDYQKAVDILEKEALAMDPDDAHALAWLGLALFCAGRKEEAELRLRKVLAGNASESSEARELACSLLKEMGAETS